jgi:hypothetical protein
MSGLGSSISQMPGIARYQSYAAVVTECQPSLEDIYNRLRLLEFVIIKSPRLKTYDAMSCHGAKPGPLERWPIGLRKYAPCLGNLCQRSIFLESARRHLLKGRRTKVFAFGLSSVIDTNLTLITLLEGINTCEPMIPISELNQQ